tara:strand:+ start:19464 stop:19685 length:222 start_codon:yes stop_codon:yes gene_type:complete
MAVTKADLQDWNSNPVTIAIFKELKEARQEALERQTLMLTADETAMATAKNVGFVEGVSALLDAYEYALEEAD